MMRGIQDVFSEYERGLIRSRTKAALAAKRARGERIGAIPYGYTLSDDGVRLVNNPSEQSVIARVHHLRASGTSLRGIVATLERAGCVSRAGTPLGLRQVARIVGGANG
jgi:DNA invertase Pin-like site-specific DNA recombinase